MKFTNLMMLAVIVSAQEKRPQEKPPAEQDEQDEDLSEEEVNNFEEAQDTLSLLMDTTWVDWGLFAVGVGLGVSSTQAENIPNECIAGSFAVVNSGWNVYYYMDQYMQTEEDVQMAWGITYLVKGFEDAYTLDCSNIESEVKVWWDDLVAETDTAAAPKVRQEEEAEEPMTDEAQFTTALFEGVYEVLTDFSILIGAMEIYIDSSTALDNIAKGKFFQAGYFLGSGGFEFIWTGVDIVDKYIDVWNKYYG